LRCAYKERVVDEASGLYNSAIIKLCHNVNSIVEEKNAQSLQTMKNFIHMYACVDFIERLIKCNPPPLLSDCTLIRACTLFNSQLMAPAWFYPLVAYKTF
jgi:hypothetical protein